MIRRSAHRAAASNTSSPPLSSASTLSLPASPSPLPAAADPLQALRSATAALHASLDASLPIAQPHASIADYAAHAHALMAWLGALQPQIDRLAAETASFAFCPPGRLAALRADLEDLDQPVPAPAALVQSSIAALLKSQPQHADAVRWGLAYVVEGSQLGGQVLYRRLAPCLAPHPLRYLQGSGTATASRWKEFLSLLRQRVATPAAMHACCEGAVAAFESLAHVMSMPHREGAAA